MAGRQKPSDHSAMMSLSMLNRYATKYANPLIILPIPYSKARVFLRERNNETQQNMKFENRSFAESGALAETADDCRAKGGTYGQISKSSTKGRTPGPFPFYRTLKITRQGSRSLDGRAAAAASPGKAGMGEEIECHEAAIGPERKERVVHLRRRHPGACTQSLDPGRS